MGAERVEECVRFLESILAQSGRIQAQAEGIVYHLREFMRLREELKARPKAELPKSKKERVQLVRGILEDAGYEFKRPTLVLEGQDGWFVILTPRRKPFQAIAHYDGKVGDFFATIPELIE